MLVKRNLWGKFGRGGYYQFEKQRCGCHHWCGIRMINTTVMTRSYNRTKFEYVFEAV